MGARYCIKCRKADNGDGQWVSSDYWSDTFLREANKTIIKRGKIIHLICEPCEKDINSRKHLVRRSK